MEHERGAFKVNRDLMPGAVKNGPENALGSASFGLVRTLQRKNTVPEI